MIFKYTSMAAFKLLTNNHFGWGCFEYVCCQANQAWYNTLKIPSSIVILCQFSKYCMAIVNETKTSLELSLCLMC